MRSLYDIAVHFGTDKVESGYIDAYEQQFGAWRTQPIALLELGVLKGASLLTWQEYFSVGTIVGLDENEVEISAPTHHIRVYRGAQDDPAVLNRIAEENAPNGFDIVIDDASHVGTVSRTAFWHIFEKHLKLGGIYVVEDWGTGYWPSWPDGAQYRGAMAFQNPVVRHLAATLAHIDTNFSAHNHGMVGFIKELVDECGRGDITHPQRGVPPHRNSRIERLCIRPGQVFATKPK